MSLSSHISDARAYSAVPPLWNDIVALIDQHMHISACSVATLRPFALLLTPFDAQGSGLSTPLHSSNAPQLED